VAGLRNAKFAKPVANIRARGAKTLHRFPSARVPKIPDGVELVPGYVRARKTGTPVWIPKYIGNIFCCNVANCGRERVLKAATPPIKLCGSGSTRENGL
jgi:hypothetical protein